MDFIDRIGPILGIAAFLGLAVLIVLVFLQAREVRRLREWAGRAPERALDAGEAIDAAAEARAEDPDAPPPGRFDGIRDRFDDRFGDRWDTLDRRSPIDPRLLVAGMLALVIAAGVLTSGFGLAGGGDSSGGGAHKGKKASKKSKQVDVAVFNATQADGVAGVPGLADKVAKQAVDSKKFNSTVTEDAPAGVPDSVVMFAKDSDSGDAEELAAALEPMLGKTGTEQMTAEIKAETNGAPLAVLIGLADDEF
ncbi:hypothetical protein BH10ACT11_BH10ACT11_05800 [soil metagenome]